MNKYLSLIREQFKSEPFYKTSPSNIRMIFSKLITEAGKNDDFENLEFNQIFGEIKEHLGSISEKNKLLILHDSVKNLNTEAKVTQLATQLFAQFATFLIFNQVSSENEGWYTNEQFKRIREAFSVGAIHTKDDVFEIVYPTMKKQKSYQL